jgi:restriction system protein
MKNSSKKYRTDIIVVSIIALVALFYYTGAPSTVIIDLSKIVLILAAIGYVLTYPLIDIFMTARYDKERRRISKLKQSTNLIDAMSWKEFEIYVAKWLKSQGYSNIELTEQYDLGVDIIAEKDGVRWGVQVKHYTTMVKIEAVRQVVVALKLYKCDKAMVVTNSFFSRPAKKLAASQDCVLVERNQLRKGPAIL